MVMANRMRRSAQDSSSMYFFQPSCIVMAYAIMANIAVAHRMRRSA